MEVAEKNTEIVMCKTTNNKKDSNKNLQLSENS
jgi:hypothetical protein